MYMVIRLNSATPYSCVRIPLVCVKIMVSTEPEIEDSTHWNSDF